MIQWIGIFLLEYRTFCGVIDASSKANTTFYMFKLHLDMG